VNCRCGHSAWISVDRIRTLYTDHAPLLEIRGGLRCRRCHAKGLATINAEDALRRPAKF
jgi:hypothetical protein